jgi:hypothetical protein
LAGGRSERSCELTGGGGNGGSAGGGLTRERSGKRIFISERAQASLLRSEVTDALRRGVRRPSACVRDGRTDDATASTRTPRGAQAHRPRRVLEVRAGLTHTALTPKLRGLAMVRQRMAEAQQQRVDARARATSRRCVPGPEALHVPLFGHAMHKIFNANP